MLPNHLFKVNQHDGCCEPNPPFSTPGSQFAAGRVHPSPHPSLLDRHGNLAPLDMPAPYLEDCPIVELPSPPLTEGRPTHPEFLKFIQLCRWRNQQTSIEGKRFTTYALRHFYAELGPIAGTSAGLSRVS